MGLLGWILPYFLLNTKLKGPQRHSADGNAHSMLLSPCIPQLNSDMFVRLLCQKLFEWWMWIELNWNVQNTNRTQVWQQETGSPLTLTVCKHEGKRQHGRSRRGRKIFQENKPMYDVTEGHHQMSTSCSLLRQSYLTVTLFHPFRCCG